MRLGAPIGQARAVVLEAVQVGRRREPREVRITVGDVGEKVVWLTATAFAPLDADVTAIASDVRERALDGARATAELLPAP